MTALGVLDWGIGGLDVVAKLRAAGMQRPIVYLSDAGALPYGKQSDAALAGRAKALVKRFADHGCDEVVLACNAASTVLPALTGLPVRRILGVIQPGIEATVRAGVRDVVVLGGRRTIDSGHYSAALRPLNINVTEVVAQPLSALIERGIVSGPELDSTLEQIVSPVRNATAIVSACTHYLAARPALHTALARLRTVIDPAQALVDLYFGHAAPGPFPDRYWTTGDPARSRRAAVAVFGFDAPFEAAGVQFPAPC
ncbi:MAG: aspartate/glutamate racemase family protein [Nannocystaceae bacterium]|nr:aspartate/glutamate racemase family protein [Nannocystaceae bacterium]